MLSLYEPAPQTLRKLMLLLRVLLGLTMLCGGTAVALRTGRALMLFEGRPADFCLVSVFVKDGFRDVGALADGLRSLR